MNIVFNAVSNCLTRLDENLVTAYSQVTAEFYFTSEWYGLSRKTAVFSCNGNVYYAILNVDNIADVPPECLTNDVQSFTVSVFGDNLITTNEIVVNVATSSDGGEGGETRLDITDKNIASIFDNTGDVELEQVENEEDPTVNKYKLVLTNNSKTLIESKADKEELKNYYTKEDIDNKKYLTEIPEEYVNDEYLSNKLSDYQEKLTFDSIPTTGSNNPVTSSGIASSLSGKQDNISGANGEVLYHSGTNVFTQTLMNEGKVVLTEEDLVISESVVPSFKDVFNNWTRFSILNGVDNAKPSELSGWKYDSSLDTIVMPLNTESYCGFVSPQTYSNYDITVRLYSNGADNDTIGLVAAFALDSSGKQHTLSFLRTCGDPGATWLCKVDYCTFSNRLSTYGQITLADKSSAAPSRSNNNWSTSSVGVGTTVRMIRSGNVFTATCSQYNSRTLDNNTTITIDLDKLSSQYPILNLFKGSSSWGYSTLSQPNSKYENVDVSNPNDLIYDIKNNKVLKYSTSSKTWNVVPGKTPVKEIGAGRFSFNKDTGKLFYCNGYSVYQIAKI